MILIIACVVIALFVYRKLSWTMGTVDFTDKVVLITGASSGIGEALVKEMCTLGCKKIIIAARRMNELERVKQECSHPDIVECW